ncbi:MAG: hypothetical protein R2912_02605 [Eubacteriales bacterium]
MEMTGMFYWGLCDEDWKYGLVRFYERVVEPICMPRSRISIGVSLTDDSYQNYNYAPVGVDCIPRFSNVLAAGVFSDLSILVFYSKFRELIPDQIWTIYQLSDTPMMQNPQKKTYPRVGFRTGDEAIKATKHLVRSSGELNLAHEKEALEQRKYYFEKVKPIMDKSTNKD